MTHEELYQKTEEVIAQFKDGRERYKTSVTFNRVVQMLVRGEDTYHVIDSLCRIVDDMDRAFNQYIVRDDRPIIHPKAF